MRLVTFARRVLKAIAGESTKARLWPDKEIVQAFPVSTLPKKGG